MFLKSRLFPVIAIFGFSSFLFAQEVGPIVNSQAQKAAACAYNKDSVDKASNFEVNAARHLGSLGFFMEQESAPKEKRGIRKVRGKGSVR